LQRLVAGLLEQAPRRQAGESGDWVFTAMDWLGIPGLVQRSASIEACVLRRMEALLPAWSAGWWVDWLRADISWSTKLGWLLTST
jgi:hypothetical protein